MGGTFNRGHKAETKEMTVVSVDNQVSDQGTEGRDLAPVLEDAHPGPAQEGASDPAMEESEKDLTVDAYFSPLQMALTQTHGRTKEKLQLVGKCDKTISKIIKCMDKLRNDLWNSTRVIVETTQTLEDLDNLYDDESLKIHIESHQETCNELMGIIEDAASRNYDEIDKHTKEIDKDYECVRADALEKARESKSVPSFLHKPIVSTPNERNEGSDIDDDIKYCICRQGNFGIMVQCTSEDCEIGWFHAECVNIVDQHVPDNWRCENCEGNPLSPSQSRDPTSPASSQRKRPRIDE